MYSNSRSHDVISEAGDANHIRYLLKLIIKEVDSSFHISEDFSLNGVINKSSVSPIYIHITPLGSSIISNISINNGVCVHPLARLLFWSFLLRFEPCYISLFNDHYKERLNLDLMKYNFIEHKADNIKEMVDLFNTQICIGCCKEPTLTCRDYIGFNFHLILLAVLKNGWHGTSTEGYTRLNYLGVYEKIKFLSGGYLSFKQAVDYAYYFRHIFNVFLETIITKFYEKSETSDSSDSD